MKIKGTFLNDKEIKSINYFLTLLAKDVDNLLNEEGNEGITEKLETLKVWSNNISQIVNQ